MQELIQEYLTSEQVIGAAVCYIEKGKMDFYAQGKKSINRNDPITENTLFDLGSITKVFTTLALMDKVKKEEMKLNDPIEKFLPGIQAPQLDGYRISVGNLATHTSGLPSLPENFAPTNPSNQYADYTKEKLYDFLHRHTLRKRPGKHLVYSNFGIGLLGHILSIQSGKTYEELIVNLISEPLGMKDTLITLNPEQESRLCPGHHQGQIMEKWDMGILQGEGAVRSSVQDMCRFLAANMGLIDSPITSLLKECHQPFYKTDTLTVGLGWIILNGVIMHSGGTNGSRSFIGFNPQTEKGVLILSNSRAEWPDDLGKLLLDPTYQRPKINKELASDPDYLKQFAGSYEVSFPNGSPKQEMQINVMDTHLALLFKNGSTGILYPEKFSIFGVRGFTVGRIQFSFNSEGSVSLVQAIHNEGKVLWEAVPKFK